jgi:MFS family permease
MVVGMFVFGLGISPLSVVQETIIVRFFKSHGLGVSMALGLLAGKSASFISAHTSFTLTHAFGPRAPFYVAVLLAASSVLINLIYIVASKWLIDGANAELEATDVIDEAHHPSYTLSEAQALQEAAERRKVHLTDISRLGDLFWAYVHFSFNSGACLIIKC